MARAKVAVVTGAGNGIGRSLSLALCGSGWVVVGVDHDGPALEGLRADCNGFSYVRGDVRDVEVLRNVRVSAEQAGDLRAWINNAGIMRLAPLHLMGNQDIDDVLDVDLRAVVYGVREALRSFLFRSVPGSIVNVSSIHGRSGFPGSGPYDAAKGGVEALTRYVCVEYGHLGIRCNAVAPGAVNTNMSTTVGSADDLGIWPPSKALAPMQRASEPNEVAEAALYLLSDTAIAVNGHVLAIDNGMAARSYAFRPDPKVHFDDASHCEG